MKKWTIEDARELYNISGWGTSRRVKTLCR